jgi:hypothetical protein
MDNTNKQPPKKMPIWVLLAFSSIQKRKSALILIWASIIFTAYCLPWATFINNEMITTLFLIDDWSWITMMIPICIWYILSLRWMDQNNSWENT